MSPTGTAEVREAKGVRAQRGINRKTTMSKLGDWPINRIFLGLLRPARSYGHTNALDNLPLDQLFTVHS